MQRIPETEWREQQEWVLFLDANGQVAGTANGPWQVIALGSMVISANIKAVELIQDGINGK